MQPLGCAQCDVSIGRRQPIADIAESSRIVAFRRCRWYHGQRRGYWVIYVGKKFWKHCLAVHDIDWWTFIFLVSYHHYVFVQCIYCWNISLMLNFLSIINLCRADRWFATYCTVLCSTVGRHYCLQMFYGQTNKQIHCIDSDDLSNCFYPFFTIELDTVELENIELDNDITVRLTLYL